jgi:hypothetical protein
MKLANVNHTLGGVSVNCAVLTVFFVTGIVSASVGSAPWHLTWCFKP